LSYGPRGQQPANISARKRLSTVFGRILPPKAWTRFVADNCAGIRPDSSHDGDLVPAEGRIVTLPGEDFSPKGVALWIVQHSSGLCQPPI